MATAGRKSVVRAKGKKSTTTRPRKPAKPGAALRTGTRAVRRAAADAPKSPYPKAGTAAPAFLAAGSGGKTVKLSDFRGKKIVALFFYPKDHTSGCTTEACEFRDERAALTRAGVVVLGVSPDSVKSHDSFQNKFDLPFPLLADEDRRICKAYGVWQQKSMYGRKYMGVARTTFVIDRHGKIAHVFEKVKPAGHAEAVLAWIRGKLRGG